MSAKNLFLILTCIGAIFGAYAQETASSYPTKKELLNLIDSQQLPAGEKINNLRMLGQYYMGEPNDSAAFYFNKGLLISKKEQDSFNAMRLYNRMALLQIYNEDDPAAIKYTDSAFSYASRNNQKHFASIAYSYQIQARANYYQELNDLALEKYLEANKYLLKDNQDPETKTFLAENYADLASLYLETDNKKTALVCINKSLNLSKPIEAWWEVGEAYEFLAAYYFEEEDYDRARVYVDSSKTMYRRVDYQEGVQTLDKYLSDIYLKEKKYDEAIATYTPLLKNDKSLEVPYALVEDYLFISEVYTEKDEIQLATTYLDSAKIASLESNNLLHPINIGRQQADIYKVQNNNKAAIKEFTRLLNSEAIKGYVETEKDITKDLYELHEKSNNTVASLMYYKRYNKLKDSLADALAENKFSVLKSEFNYNELNSKL
jgi:tetratricopeptide (TPR) repeat protein